MFGFKKRSGPSHFNKPPTREEFEESLRMYFEQVDKYAHGRGSEWVDTFGKLKNKIGGVWGVIIDDMHHTYTYYGYVIGQGLGRQQEAEDEEVVPSSSVAPG